jgi:hypothetical protein
MIWILNHFTPTHYADKAPLNLAQKIENVTRFVLPGGLPNGDYNIPMDATANSVVASAGRTTPAQPLLKLLLLLLTLI